MTTVRFLSLVFIALFLTGCIPASQPTNQRVSVHTNVPNLVDNDSSTPLVPQQEW